MTHEFPFIQRGEEQVEVLSFLGAGGSKSVFEVSINGIRRAIAMPNLTDPLNVREQKWQKALQEPEQSAFLRDNGLLVNPYYGVENVSINGKNTDTLIMTPFSELPFDVHDGKDGSKTWDIGPLSYVENYKDLMPAMLGISKDIKILAKLGVELMSDSISFASMPDGEMRLFLFDFDGMSLSDGSEGLAESYAQLVVNKLDNILDFKQGLRFARQGYDLTQRRKLAAQLAIY